MGTNYICLGVVGFGSAGMLFWSLCAAIPLILHLLKRHRQQIVKWAAIDLLMKVIQQQSRRVRIEQLILLALRMLACCLLALALARPFYQSASVAGDVDLVVPPRLWVVVLDCSYSMGYQQASETRFAAAKARAAELIATSQPGDSFALISLGKPSRAIISRVTFDRASMASQLNELELLDTGADLTSCLQAIEDIAQDDRNFDSKQRRVQIVILTDLGRDTWESATDSVVKQRFARLAAKHKVTIESVVSGVPANMAVTDIVATRVGSSNPGRLRIEASVANFSSAFANGVPIQFLIDDQTVHSEFLDLGIRQVRTVHAEVPCSSPEECVVAVAIPHDRLEVDNRREVVVPERKQIRVLCVEQNPGDARMTALAVAPTGKADELMTTRTISYLELTSQDFTNSHAIVLCGANELAEATAVRLRQFVDRGGGLAVFLGPATQIEVWNQLSRYPDRDLLGLQLLEPSKEETWQIDPLEYTSPVVTPFADFPDSGLLTTPIFRYWRIQPQPTAELTVDVSLQNSEPLIVRRKIGRGWVAIWLSMPQAWQHTSAGNQPLWNAIATWPSFVPLLRQSVQVITSGEAQARNILVGQSMTGIEPANSQLRVVFPNGRESPMGTVESMEDGHLKWRLDDTMRRGIYRLERADKTTSKVIANIDPTESSLESVGLGSLPTSTTSLDTDLDPANIDANHEIHDRLARILLSTLLLVLVAESLLAWSMGRRLT